MGKIMHIVREAESGMRVDKLVTSLDEEWTRTQVQGWIKNGLVTVNDKEVKTNYRCETDDEIIIQIPEPVPLEIKPEKMELDIYYEDADVIVINKPRGMVVHPAPGHSSGTLVNGLLAHCQDLSGINGVLRPGIVHRIDKDTSGLIMVAKNDFSHEKLAEQLLNKTVTRKYEAIVHDVIPHDYGTIDAPIARDKHDRKKMAVADDGKPAVTHFRVIQRFQNFTHIECELETGRTHQIRVHMKYIGYPIAGDPKYGPKKTPDIGGQALHAALLGFHHPRTGKYMEFRAPVPEDFQQLLEQLK